ncbi:MAG: hypothetical protein GVY16_00820 [Planctomycetes bacterium]|jgi:hypothetical protein|nr:hypothetical protein [Phycisphaerae bacterium]NBB94267.1 hypothetical protein [Planctomycetota bacterium]
MDSDRARRELKALRELMERPVRYSTQSGLAAIWAGAVALLGLWLDDWLVERYIDQPRLCAQTTLAAWAGIFALASAGVLLLTRLRERKAGMPLWSQIKTRILLTIAMPWLAGIGVTLVIFGRWYYGLGPNQWGLIPPLWMLCHGIACWQVGESSIRELRWMGLAFVVGGLVTAGGFQTYPYWSLGLTFGGLHLIYGIIVTIRYGG